MGEPLPYDPEDRPAPNRDRRDLTRADWIVGAEEGASAEVSRSHAELESPFAQPRLSRPTDGDAPAPRSSSARLPFPGRTPPPPPAAMDPVAPPAPPPALPTWERGASSIPMMKRERDAEVTPGPAIPELSREFPMDDAEERARVAAEVAERRAHEEAIASRPHAVVKPDEFAIPAVPDRGLSAIRGAIFSDRRVQAILGVLVLSVLAMTFWPREEKTISVAHLKADPERYADSQVRVGGVVSEVFPVGGSWAYSLVQGRDTIVVFTRVREPRLHEKVVVVGTLSSGYLDGVSRAAIFETTR